MLSSFRKFSLRKRTRWLQCAYNTSDIRYNRYFVFATPNCIRMSWYSSHASEQHLAIPGAFIKVGGTLYSNFEWLSETSGRCNHTSVPWSALQIVEVSKPLAVYKYVLGYVSPSVE